MMYPDYQLVTGEDTRSRFQDVWKRPWTLNAA